MHINQLCKRFQVIGGNAVELINDNDANNVCSRYDSCQLCSVHMQCVWNYGQQKCYNRSSLTLSEQTNLVLNSEDCYQCSHSLNCTDCLKV